VSKSINKIPKGWERISVGEWSNIGDKYRNSVTGKWEDEAYPTLVQDYHVAFIRAVKHPAKPKRVRKAKAVALPKEWDEAEAAKFVGGSRSALMRAFQWNSTPQGEGYWRDIYGDEYGNKYDEGRRIVRKWLDVPTAKKAASPTPRRESRVSLIATVIQRAISGQIPTAMDGAREVETIIDNSQRAKRRKEGGK